MPNIVTFNIDDIKKQQPVQIQDQIEVHSQQQQAMQENVQEMQQINIDEILVAEEIDATLIECFYGTKIDDIIAVTTALQYMLEFKKSYDFEWIFVEAQTDEHIAVFKWIQQYGIKYIFKKLAKKQQYLDVKMPLLNIGAKYSTKNKFLFIDSDVYFEDKTWMKKAVECLERKDAAALSRNIRQYKSNNSFESIGFQLASNNELTRHYNNKGFSFGITKDAFKILDNFDATYCFDEAWLWMKITGKTDIFISSNILPYQPDDTYKNGCPFEIGYVDATALYCSDEMKDSSFFDVLHYISYYHFNQQDAISYDRHNINKLPEWNNNLAGKLMHNVFEKLNKTGNISKDDYASSLKNICKEIDNSSQLVITTMYWPDYAHKNIDCIIDFKNKLDEYCKNDYTFICFSNENIDGIDTIKYKKLKTKKDSIEQALSEFNDNCLTSSNVAYIDITENIGKDFEFYRCPIDKLYSKDNICKLYDNFKELRYFCINRAKNISHKKKKTRKSNLKNKKHLADC